MSDKRRSHRLKIELPASFEIKSFAGNQISIATTLDISATGICLVSKEKLNIHDKMTVNVNLGKEGRVKVDAEVVWVKSAASYGGSSEYHIGLKIREPLTDDATKFVRFYATELLNFFKKP